jgi:uncharacterized protein
LYGLAIMTTDAALPNVPPALPTPADQSRIAQDLQLRKVQVEHVVQLLAEGESIPFIARYRRDKTAGLPEMTIRLIADRIHQIRQHAERKQTILRNIEAQGRLSPELKAAIEAADQPRRLEDLYTPFKPKKKPLAAEAREKGLEAFAAALWMADPAVANLEEVLPGMVDPEKQINSPDDILNGARAILAELIGDSAEVRGAVRKILWDTAKLVAAKHEKLAEGKGLEYKDYFAFTEAVQKVPPHRVLAINRGERENALAVRLDYDAEAVRAAAHSALPTLAEHPHRGLLLGAVDDALAKVVLPAIEREIRRDLTEIAQRHAVDVFARNLRGLLMAPPLPGKRVLAIDPGFRQGCRVVAIDEHGQPLEDAAVYPFTPQKKMPEARLVLEKLIRKHQTPVVAIGNGLGGRETEELIAELITYFEKRRRGELPAEKPEPAESPTAEAVVEPAPATEVAVAVEVPAVSSEPTTSAEQAPSANQPAVAEPGVADSVAAPESAGPAEPKSVLAGTTTATVPEAPTAPPAKPPRKSDAEEKARIAALKLELEALPEPPADLAYVLVNEAGASDYAVSAIGREELPQLDTATRAAVSIGRRLQNPLAELVKIDPQHVGVGLYQHDVQGKAHKTFLEGVIESCVNHVGVDVNEASAPLLARVAGFNPLIARAIIEYRQQHGPFRTLEQLAQVPGVGPDRLAQAAGFLRLHGDEPLDATTLHPGQYDLARRVLAEFELTPADLFDPVRLEEFRRKLAPVEPAELAKKYEISEPAMWDLLDALTQPGRDPRADSPPPIFRRDVLKIEDMKVGMELKGTVLNVVDFGAFVDVGLKDSGLVHISQLANRYVRNPHEIVTVGDVVTVWVLNVDQERRRVSLTMIPPGTPKTPVVEKPKPRSFAPAGSQPRQPRGEQRPRQGGRPPQRRGPQRDRAAEPHAEEPTGEAAGTRNTARFERKPRPPKPLPTLSKEKKEGKAYLNTLGELEAFFKAREGANPPSSPPPDSPPSSAAP